jgi:signal transduction histidine kinase
MPGSLTRARVTRSATWRRWLADRDVQVAIVLAVIALAQVLVFWPIAPRLIGVVVALGSTLPICWRRSHPVAATLAGTAVWLIPTDGFILVGYIAAFLLYYGLTAYQDDLHVAAAVVIIGAAIGIATAAIQHLGIGEYLTGVLIVVAPAGVGLLARRQQEHRRRLEELNLLLERERDERTRAAIANERVRIARELHDIVSHALTVVSLQADAAGAAIEQRPDLARAPLATIRTSAHEALVEMRRLLGVLRTEPEAEDREPLPGMAQLPALLDRAAASGITAEVQAHGTPMALPQSVDLTAYRIIQEALTNTAKHAAGSRVCITLDWEADHLGVDVCDDGPGPVGTPSPDAHGLVGMRERVRIHGGDFCAGAGADGGFRVQARLPIESRS